MPFRFNRKDVFLTFSRVPKRFTPQMVLSEINKKAEVEKYVISVEKHSESKRRPFHIHAYIEFVDKLDTKNERFFDIEFYGVPHHPNIQKPKKRHAVMRYVKKDGNYIENFDSRPIWLQLYEDSADKETFLKELMWSLNRIDSYAGYRTLRDLFDMKKSLAIPEETVKTKIMKELLGN